MGTFSKRWDREEDENEDEGYDEEWDNSNLIYYRTRDPYKKSNKSNKRKCQFCKKIFIHLPFICNYCGKANCGKHRLPEDHDCKGMKIERKLKINKKSPYEDYIIDDLNILDHIEYKKHKKKKSKTEKREERRILEKEIKKEKIKEISSKIFLTIIVLLVLWIALFLINKGVIPS